MSKNLEKNLEQLDIRRRITTIKTAELQKSVWTLNRDQEI